MVLVSGRGASRTCSTRTPTRRSRATSSAKLGASAVSRSCPG